MNQRIGERVSWFDHWRQVHQTGVIVGVRRSSSNPWNVAVVRLSNGTEVEVHPERLESAVSTTFEELARRTAAINYEIVITHGLDGGVGFEWNGLFIHNPFADPQYGFFDVEPVQQYGDAYTGSVFVTDPATALETVQSQLRERANEDLSRYCTEHGQDAAAVIESVTGLNLQVNENALEAIADEQVAAVWAHVDGLAGWEGKL
jgi:hypothetical protein